jgi:phage-related protein
MQVFTYTTRGDKDLIYGFINSLPTAQQTKGHEIICAIEKDGIKALEFMDTRQLRKKLYEIKFSKNRLMYVIEDEDNMYILHACKKQKGKAEEFEINKAIKRAKNLGKELNKEFV